MYDDVVKVDESRRRSVMNKAGSPNFSMRYLFFILCHMWVFGQDVGVPYVSEEIPTYKLFSDDDKYFISGEVLFDAQTYRSIKKLRYLPCKSKIKKFTSLTNIQVVLEDRAEACNLNLVDNTIHFAVSKATDRALFAKQFNVMSSRLKFSSDERYVAYVGKRRGYKKGLNIWDTKNSSYLDLSPFGIGRVKRIAFSDHGSKLSFTERKDKKTFIRIIDVDKLSEIASIEENKTNDKLYFSDDDTSLVGIRGNDVTVYDLTTFKQCRIENAVDASSIRDVHFRRGSQGVVGYRNQKSFINVDNCTVKKHLFTEPVNDVIDKISASGQKMYRLNKTNGKFSIWQLKPFSKLREFTMQNAHDFALTDDENRLLLSYVITPKNKTNGVSLWDVKANKSVGFLLHEDAVRDMAVVDKQLFTVTDNYVRRWNIQTLQEEKKVELNITRPIIMPFAPTQEKTQQDYPHKLMLNKDASRLILWFSANVVVMDPESLQVLKKIETGTSGFPYAYVSFDENVLYYDGKYILDLKTLETTKYQVHPVRIDRPNSWWIREHYSTPSEEKVLIKRKRQSIEFLNTKTQEVYAEFYVFPDGEWVLMTPEGYFDCSANGRQYINVLVSPLETRVIDEDVYAKFHKKINIGK